MALINCPECGRTVSSASSKCPHCGYPLPGEQAASQESYQHTENSGYQYESQRTEPFGERMDSFGERTRPFGERPQYGDKPACPETHLAKAIIVTLLCCWPFGIPAIINAANVNNLYLQGRYQEAEEASRNANKWANVSLWVGVGVTVLYLIFYFVVFSLGVIGSTL